MLQDLMDFSSMTPRSEERHFGNTEYSYCHRHPIYNDVWFDDRQLITEKNAISAAIHLTSLSHQF